MLIYNILISLSTPLCGYGSTLMSLSLVSLSLFMMLFPVYVNYFTGLAM